MPISKFGIKRRERHSFAIKTAIRRRCSVVVHKFDDVQTNKSVACLSVQIDLLSHATYLVQAKAQPVLREELKLVSIPEMEAAERALLQGCDGFLRCHHPYGACKMLASDVSNYLMSEPTQEFVLEGEGGIESSPKSVVYDYPAAVSPTHREHDANLSTLAERSLSLAQWALVYSDVNFLFPPGQIAFAAVAVALDGQGHGTRLGEGMRQYLEMRFRNKTLEELDEFEGQVGKIISLLEDCSAIDLGKFSPNWQYYLDGAAVDEHQAAELHRVFYKASQLRSKKGDNTARPSTPPQTSFSPAHYYHPHGYGGYHHYHEYHPRYHHYHHQQPHHHHYYPPQPQHFLPIITEGSRKRGREEDRHQPHAAAEPLHAHKVARVTPVMMDY